MDRKKAVQKNLEEANKNNKKGLKSDAAKCVKLIKLFSKGLNSAAAEEDSSNISAAEVRRKQKIQLAQVIFTLLLVHF